jgi:hypothetical protein
MKEWKGVGVWFRSFFTLAIMGLMFNITHVTAVPIINTSVRGWKDLKADLNTVIETKFSSPTAI